MCFFFFFSSRRRHTRCALVTGVQTCALPICAASCAEFSRFGRTRRPMTIPIDPLKLITAAAAPLIKAVGREYKLRGADEKLIAFTGIAAEMSAALAVLARNANKPEKALTAYLKGKITGGPAFFDETPDRKRVVKGKSE